MTFSQVVADSQCYTATAMHRCIHVTMILSEKIDEISKGRR